MYLLVADKASKTFVANRGAKRLQFFGPAFGDEFDAAIGKIADAAADFKTGGDGLYGVAKPNALDAARIKNTQATTAGERRGV